MPATQAKRKRTYVEVTDSDEDPEERADRFHRKFTDVQADIILRSREGILFGVRQAALASVSAVFENMFEIPQPPGAEARGPAEQAAGRALQVVQMTEKGQELEIYLSWIQHHTFPEAFKVFKSRWRFLNTSSRGLLRLLDCASKFETPSIYLPVFAMIHTTSVGSQPENAAAIGIVYEQDDLVEDAMNRWILISASGSQRESPRHNVCVSRIWPSLVDRLPKRSLQHIAIALKNIHGGRNGGGMSVEELNRRVETFMTAYKTGFPRM